MKFEGRKRMAAAAAMAAAECVGCAPNLEFGKIGRPHDASSLQYDALVEVKEDRREAMFAEEVNRLEVLCGASDSPGEVFKKAPQHVQVLFMKRFVDAFSRGEIPRFIQKRQHMSREHIESFVTSNLMSTGTFIGAPDGRVTGFRLPNKLIPVQVPMSPVDAHEAHLKMLNVDHGAYQPTKVISPYMLEVRNAGGQDFVTVPGFTPFAIKERLPSGAIKTKDDATVEPLPHGARYVSPIHQREWRNFDGIEREVRMSTDVEKPGGSHRVEIWSFPFDRMKFKTEGDVLPNGSYVPTYAEVMVGNSYSSQLGLGKKGEMLEAMIQPDHATVVFDEHGLPVADVGSGELRLFGPEGAVGTWDEEAAKTPGLTMDRYAGMVSKHVRTPRQWFALAKAYSWMETEHPAEDPMRNDPMRFAHFVQMVLEKQGTTSGVVTIPNIGPATVWIVARENGMDLYGVGKGRVMKNFFDFSQRTTAEDLAAIPPYPTLRDAFNVGVRKLAKPDDVGKLETAFGIWDTFSRKIPVYRFEKDGKYKEEEVLIDELSQKKKGKE